MKKAVLAVGALTVAGLMFLTVAVFAVTVWPTKYRTERGVLAGQSVMMRTDRLTGRMEYLTSARGWRPVPGTIPVQTVAGPPKPACTAEQIKALDPNDPFADIGLACTLPPRD